MTKRLHVKIAHTLETALLSGQGKPIQDRLLLLVAARDEALEMCGTDEQRLEVENRHLEKRLLSACMFGGTSSEILEAKAMIEGAVYKQAGLKEQFIKIAGIHLGEKQ